LTADLLGLQNLQTRPSARSYTSELPTIEIRASRKSSIQHVRSWGQGTPQRQDSAQSYANGEGTEPSSAHTVDHDEYFEHVQSPSPTHPIAHDILSVSTVGAGPSVQLVERMSAAVRRLESERVSTKEELRRLSEQRNEARAQIVTLMQEVEAKRNLDIRVRELEEENRKINARYQTTLEMLGEKSELVEELRADVQDVKDMYRELVERTVK
jgi:TATA element modulatory factor